MAQKHIVIICGEASGDLNAANLARAIKEIDPLTRISGVGGTLLRNAGADIYYDIKDLGVIGIFDVLKKLPKFFALKKIALERLRQESPDAVILVDFSGFNLRLAKAIGNTVPVIYYISPQVWASRPGRIKNIKAYIRKMIVLFKFEQEFYKKYGIDADFVGHPLLDTVMPTKKREMLLQEFGLAESKPTIALLPGSRETEIKNILPVMIKAAVLTSREIAAQFIIAKHPGIDLDIYEREMQKFNLDLKIIEGRTYDCLELADLALVASGTATLETAIMQKPCVIIYKMSLLNYLFYRPQVKIPFIGMPNIVAQRKIVPELIQSQASAANISDEILKIMRNPQEAERIKTELGQIRSLLGENGASKRAAQLILNFMEKNESKPH